jgi:hypothetical protein
VEPLVKSLVETLELVTRSPSPEEYLVVPLVHTLMQPLAEPPVKPLEKVLAGPLVEPLVEPLVKPLVKSLVKRLDPLSSTWLSPLKRHSQSALSSPL